MSKKSIVSEILRCFDSPYDSRKNLSSASLFRFASRRSQRQLVLKFSSPLGLKFVKKIFEKN